MKISILLPYKENFSPEYAGAVSLFVKDTASIQFTLSPGVSKGFVKRIVEKLNGAMEIGNSLSCLDSTSPGVHDLGLLRSPNANKRANLFL